MFMLVDEWLMKVGLVFLRKCALKQSTAENTLHDDSM